MTKKIQCTDTRHVWDWVSPIMSMADDPSHPHPRALCTCGKMRWGDLVRNSATTANEEKSPIRSVFEKHTEATR